MIDDEMSTYIYAHYSAQQGAFRYGAIFIGQYLHTISTNAWPRQTAPSGIECKNKQLIVPIISLA
jgi:hypothetical protein